MKKTTLATIKCFISTEAKRNNLYIKELSKFNGMTDGTEEVNDDFHLVDSKLINLGTQYTFGISKAWFVGYSRDYFTVFADEKYIGYKVHNSCGSFILAMDRKRVI